MPETATTERKLVLEMLADGKISVDEAQQLLAKLEEIESNPSSSGGAGAPPGKRPKHLRILANDGTDEDAINLRIPLGLVRAGLVLDSFLPSWIRERSGIYVGSSLSNVTKVDTDFVRENLEELDMTFDSEDGESVRIFVE